LAHWGVDDLGVHKDGTNNYDSHAKIGNDYESPDGMEKTQYQSFLAGSPNFKLIEVETYRVYFWFWFSIKYFNKNI